MAHPHAPPRCTGSSTPRLTQAKLLLIALNMWHRGLRDFLLQLKFKTRLTASRGKDTFSTERKSTGEEAGGCKGTKDKVVGCSMLSM